MSLKQGVQPYGWLVQHQQTSVHLKFCSELPLLGEDPFNRFPIRDPHANASVDYLDFKYHAAPGEHHVMEDFA